MSNFKVSESVICGIFESDLKCQIDSLTKVLYGVVPRQIVYSMSVHNPRYYRLTYLRFRLDAKLGAYYAALRLFRDACSVEFCCYAGV